MKILSRNEFQHRQLQSNGTGEFYSLSAVLSEALGSKDLFIRHEVLLAGSRTSAPHFHTQTDEFVFVLKGQPTIHEGEDVFQANIGDGICFQAGSGLAHSISNNGNTDVELLLVSKKLPESDIVFSPNLVE